jgi:hypothetical protein
MKATSIAAVLAGASIVALTLWARVSTSGSRTPVSGDVNEVRWTGTDVNSEKAITTGPRFRWNLLCENLKYGSACGATQSAEYVARAVDIRCGPNGEVGHIKIDFIERSGEADKYDCVRRFPIETTSTHIDHRQVEYSGHALVLFEDEYQRVTLQSPDDE